MNWQARLARMLGVTGFIVGLHPMLAQATTVNVGDYSTLANAIANCADGDTIVLTNNITVSAEFAISAKGLTIEGNNYSISVPVPGLNDSGVTNASPSAFRVFNINASGKTNTLQNMTVKGGSPSSSGGGILNTSGTLVLQSVTVAQSGGSSCSGGGVVNSSGTLYLRDCNISRNAALYGGGFLNFGAGASMFVERCTFSENRSLRSNGGGGAGENQQALYANNSTFANNKSTELGGAINNYGGTSYFVDCTFVGNVAYGTGFMGGAIANHNGTVTLVNSLFAYNYHFNGSTFDLNDIYNYSGTLPVAYYSIFQSTTNQLGGGSVGTTLYTGNISGTDDSLFCAGATAKVLGPDGTEVGTGTIYQPFLAIVGSSQTPTAVLKPGSFAFGKGARAAFSSATATPVVGYYNGSSWAALSGSDPASYEVTADQNGTGRGGSNTVGAVNSTASGLFMLKVNAAANGSVSGGTIYGDNYPSGTTVTLTAIPAAGYAFSEWDYVLGGSGVASTANCFAITLTTNVTLLPVFSLYTGFTVSYSGNGSTGGAVPSQQVVGSGGSTNIAGAGTMVRSGYSFSSWNTRTDGNGTSYAPNASYGGPDNLQLYAKWVAKAPATVVFQPASLLAIYDGTAKSVTATTTPIGLTVNITYNGSSTPPTNAGPYTVVGTISDATYAGGVTNQLRIGIPGPPVAWGGGGAGQLGNGSSTNSSVPVAVRNSGVLAGKTIIAVAEGGNQSYALTSEGLVYAWGANNYGQLGNNGSSSSSVPLLVYTNGVLSGKRITAIVSGQNHALALSADGQLFTWGWNDHGQLGNGTSVAFTNVPVAVDMTGVLAGKTVVALGVGNMHSLVATAEGKVFAWGNGGDGELGNGSTATSINNLPVAVNMSGALSGKTVIAVSGGWQYSSALTSDGLVYTWGGGGSSQLGNGATGSSSVPVTVSTSGVLSGKTIIGISSGEYHTFALSSEGLVYAWGPNNVGQLGNGTNTSSSVPVTVSTTGMLSGKHVVAVAASHDGSSALTDDGQVFCWGWNIDGKLGNASLASYSSVPVAVNTAGVLSGQTVTAISSSSDAYTVMTLTACMSAPGLTSATSVLGTNGHAFSFKVTANNADSYSCTGLPDWLTLDPATVILSGTPTSAGTFNVTVTVTNVFGSTTANLAISIPSTTTVSLASSINPAPDGGSVTFTATVSPSAASGTVTFKDRATTLGTNSVSGGTATFSTSLLSAGGTHSITAIYGGDASYYPSTSSPLTQTVNASGHPPVTVNDTLGTVKNQPVSLPAAKLAANDTDADGNTLTVTAVSAISTNGGTVALGYGYITYYPPTDVTGADSFTYTIGDGHGNTDTGTVMVAIASSTTVSLNVVYGPVVDEDTGEFVIRFAGTPGSDYTIEYADSLEEPINWQWDTIVTAPNDNANGLGKGIFEFREPTSGATSRFYRTVYPAYDQPWFPPNQ